jgi:hypothetical protein
VAYTDCIESFCDSVNVNVLQSILEGLNQVAS